MKRFLYESRLFLICITIPWLGLFSATAQESRGTTSVDPGILLKLMPIAPDQWKLTASHGYCALSAGPTMETYAVKEYLGPPPKQKDGDPTPPPPAPTTKIMMIAWGAGGELDPDFAKFKAGAASAPGQVVGNGLCMVSGFHAIKEKTGDTGDKSFLLKVSLSPLLSAIVVIQGQEESALDSWAKFIDFAKIAKAIASFRGKPINPAGGFVETKMVDELNPQNNQTSVLNY